MSEAFDIVVRGGVVVDGSGGDPFEADVGVRDGRIAAMGRGLGKGAEEVRAVGAYVTPGFVDVHTHYDGQATWTERMLPSSDHGVTTAIMGNCGVGFAPCEPHQRETMVRVMEGVEDIPEVVMTEGVPWSWRTFPDYLDFLATRRFDIDLGAQLPHSCLRVFVMGARGANREPPTDSDLARMRALTAEAIRAGALGVSTSRNLNHRTKAGELAPSVSSEERELHALAAGLRDAGGGVFQMIPDAHADQREEFQIIRRVAEVAGRPLSFTLLQSLHDPEGWRSHASGLREARGTGLPVKAQVLPRPLGLFMGLELSVHPFSLHPTYQAIAHLPLAERVAIMRDPQFRARLLGESAQPDRNPMLKGIVERQNMYHLGDPPNYAPSPDQSLPAMAKRLGLTFHELAYDALLGDEGRAILFAPGSNFAYNDLGVVREMMDRNDTVLALGDGGAHYGMICDASWPTYVLQRWVRDAADAEGFSLPWAIQALTSTPAKLVGLRDRGVLKVGMKADLNVIDLDRLALRSPRIVNDLPAGGRRLRQAADGYVATMVTGEITYRDGEATGRLPGRLVRGVVDG